MRKLSTYVAFSFLAFMVCSCSFEKRIQIQEPLTARANETCIDSFDNFAFSTPGIDDPLQETFLPGTPWQEENILPPEAQDREYQIGAVRTLSDDIEIWLQPYHPGGFYPSGTALLYNYWVFNTKSRDWRKISSQAAESKVFVDRLFVTRDGEIWGRNVWDETDHLTNSPALSRLNDLSNRFEPAAETSKIPNGVFISPSNVTPRWVWGTILLDTNNIFWFFVIHDGIYSFDPVGLSVKRHIPLENISEITQLALSPDGSIYILTTTGDYLLNTGQIYQFFPGNNSIEPISPKQVDWPAANSILVDHKDRLWLGVFGYRSPDEKWVPFHPKIEEFNRLNQNLPLWRFYQPPMILMESSDSRLWFSIPRSEGWKTLRSGLAWYDPGTNQGCWFTTEGSNVAEDAQRNLWLLARSKLYRYAVH